MGAGIDPKLYSELFQGTFGLVNSKFWMSGMVNGSDTHVADDYKNTNQL